GKQPGSVARHIDLEFEARRSSAMYLERVLAWLQVARNLKIDLLRRDVEQRQEAAAAKQRHAGKSLRQRVGGCSFSAGGEVGSEEQGYGSRGPRISRRVWGQIGNARRWRLFRQSVEQRRDGMRAVHHKRLRICRSRQILRPAVELHSACRVEGDAQCGPGREI